MNTHYDAAVVGLGPAGSIISEMLAESGLKVIAFERKTHPRFKPCAGCISQRIEGILDVRSLGVVEDTIQGVTFSYRGENAITEYAGETIAYMVRRKELDRKLAEKAGAAGAVVRQNTAVRNVTRNNGWFVLETGDIRIKAGVVVGADGALSMVRRSLIPKTRGWTYVALERRIPRRSPLNALRGRVRIDLGWVPFGYAWLFPHEDTLSAGLAVLRQKKNAVKERFGRFLESLNPGWRQASDRSTLSSHPIPCFLARNPRVASAGCILVGDAAGLTDPLTGEGIYFAVQSAQLAGRAILKHLDGDRTALAHYTHLLCNRFYSEFRHAAWLTRMIYRFPSYFFEAIRRHPEFIHLFFRILRGEESYREACGELKNRFLRKVWPWLS